MMGHGLDDGPGPAGRVAALEDARTDEDAVHAELHHQGRVGRGGDAAGREIDHGQPAQFAQPAHQLQRRADLAGKGHQLLGGHVLRPADAVAHGPGMAHGLDHVARAGLALGADHGRALGDAAQGLAQVAAAADEGDLEDVLVDVKVLVGRGQDLALVDEVHAHGLQDAGLHEMADAALGHDRDGHGSMISRIMPGSDMRPPAVGADVGGHALQGHDRAGPASSATRACSASTTSMITPPLNMRARPVLSSVVSCFSSGSWRPPLVWKALNQSGGKRQ
ncbi:hypothetical protein MASR1M66_21260 [Aminivibrio sp.]